MITVKNGMKKIDSIKKIVVLVPVIGVFTLMLLDILLHGWYGQMLDSILNILPWAVFGVWFVNSREQENFVQAIIQASFLAFIFGVLSYTIFWFPFTNFIKSVVSAAWFSDMSDKFEMISRAYNYRGLEAVGMSIGVNLVPIKKFTTYSLSHIQVVGNLIMLFPLGIYLPLLFKKVNSYRKVLLAAFLVSLSIELTQFLLSFITTHGTTFYALYQRAFDVDDIILNTAGAVIGFGAYNIFNMAVNKIKVTLKKQNVTQEAS